ncbi:MAG: TrkH family potassium uptake protein [Ruminococcaceae bacterium]|nr:TrkH family potassium uptake protein [Oscillospiraceae bacterium]
MNYKIIKHVIGWVLKIESVCMLLPFLCAIIYGEKDMLFVYSICMFICAFFGFGLSFKAPERKSMYAKEGFIIVALSWIVMSIFGALPFYISKHIPSFVDALFETVSGFTTTGASILKDVEALPKSHLLWRSFTHWLGGMGVLVFLVAILPLSGGDNFYLMKAESPGPSVSKLVPKVKSTAKILYGIYIVMTIVQIVLLVLGDMNIFDSITLSFGTAGTGGFSTRNSGISEYSSYSQIVITIFMLLFGVNFSLYYLVLLGKGNSVLKSDELRAYTGIVLTAIIIISINCFGIFGTWFESIKHSAFQVASIITTTGYSTCDFDLWPSLSKTVLVALMFIGACAGSTGGGIKVSRFIILVKSIAKEIKIAAHPKAIHKITMDQRPVEHETVRAVNVFMAAYLIIFAFSILIISIDNFDFTTNFTAIAATINNIGPGLAKVGPVQNFSIFSPLSKIVLIFDMLVGRLEIFPLLILFSPYTWKK